MRYGRVESRLSIVEAGSKGWPPVILDGAHNDASLKALRDTVDSYFGGSAAAEIPYVFIVGSTEGHDHEAMMLELARSAHTTIATQSRHPKSVAASRVANRSEAKTGWNFERLAVSIWRLRLRRRWRSREPPLRSPPS